MFDPVSSPHLVYHHVCDDTPSGPVWNGQNAIDFRGSWSECFDWIAAQPSPHPNYYLKPDRGAQTGAALRRALLDSIQL